MISEQPVVFKTRFMEDWSYKNIDHLCQNYLSWFLKLHVPGIHPGLWILHIWGWSLEIYILDN